MLACACADAGTHSRLLRSIAGGLAVSCEALDAAADSQHSDPDAPPDRAVWWACR